MTSHKAQEGVMKKDLFKRGETKGGVKERE